MPTFPGVLQNFVPLHNKAPLSRETINQQQFPYHTFAVIDRKHWKALTQHTLIINPQNISVQEPNRAQVVQTVGGAYVDDFGRGIPKVTISGHTGWRLKPMPDGSGMQDGWTAFKAFRDDIFRYFTDAKDNVRTYLRNPYYELRWYNWAQDAYYRIVPEEFDLTQDVSNPLFHQYTFTFNCIEDMTAGFHSGRYKIDMQNLSSTTGSAVDSQKIGVNVSNLGALAARMR